MSQYRTAQGRTIDMSALAARNEKTRAVGNMKVNARGDTIDGQGRIIEPVTQKVTNQYAKTVGSPSARQVTPRPQTAVPVPAKVEPVEEKLPVEEDFDSIEDIEIEQIKEQEVKAQESKKAKK